MYRNCEKDAANMCTIIKNIQSDLLRQIKLLRTLVNNKENISIYIKYKLTINI